MNRRAHVALGTATGLQASQLQTLITAAVGDGHLLPRTLADLTANAGRFVIATRGRRIVGCAELAPLSARVAEVRSLTVQASARRLGVGTMLLDELRQRACRQGYRDLCAFTHLPDYFIQRGFSIVPHLSIPEKVFSDCVTCPQYQRCGQYAMVQPLDAGVAESAAGTPVTAASAWIDHTAVFSPHA